MSSVHGITVFGGTFPAEIWHSLYSAGGVPCEEFEEPEQQISWAPYYGHFTQASPSDSVDGAAGGSDEAAAARQRRGRRLRPERIRPRRLRARRRPGTGAAAAPAAHGR